MKKWMNLFTAIAIISIFSWGCARTENGQIAQTSNGDHDHSDHDHGDHDADHDHDHEEAVKESVE